MTSDSIFTIQVFDDGRHADGRANDGVFVGTMVAGRLWNDLYRLNAEARLPDSTQYTVNGSIELHPKNDLLIADSIEVRPRNPRVGEPVTLTVTILNDGIDEFKNVPLLLDVNKSRVSEQRLVLKPGEPRRVVTTWFPSEAGSQVVQLTIKSYDEPYWSNLKNNWRRTLVQVSP